MSVPRSNRRSSATLSPVLPGIKFGSSSEPGFALAVAMNERQLRRRIEKVRGGARSRRAFLREMMALGLSAPFVTQMLAQSGVAMAASSFKYAPARAGGGGI